MCLGFALISWPCDLPVCLSLRPDNEVYVLLVLLHTGAGLVLHAHPRLIFKMFNGPGALTTNSQVYLGRGKPVLAMVGISFCVDSCLVLEFGHKRRDPLLGSFGSPAARSAVLLRDEN